ncbi:alpha-amylase [Ginsengibacter hankyongi]|uniref:Alpha-amylase n=1 Tax=Ginsengibacter hankyongi TaxID=2607284 RepID=A0A5J5IIX7_9BACT|nr:alpha-amylase family glycosyl hydrolase [Ginsengibacter hankyongi]KAA9038189.1 alpha-amylase [Ginsengibacter hankyongi]
MYDFKVHSKIEKIIANQFPGRTIEHNAFFSRYIANASSIHSLFYELYGTHEKSPLFFDRLNETIVSAFEKRSLQLQKKDIAKLEKQNWYLSNELAGMSLYVDRFSGSISGLEEKIPYLKELGINVLHLMPLFESPEGESDGGYAVSDFRKVDKRFGSLSDLQHLEQKMNEEEMYLMIDIVLNHTSRHHDWALKAKAGDKKYQDFFYMYDDKKTPDEFEKSMPEIFPESSPGNFTWVEECNKWVMTVFHHYQWDLNYTNPEVFIAMLDTIFFYANLGIDILRIDAPAFIWKQLGTTCQNLPQAHTILRLIKLCTEVATPGMALLGEAIVAPKEIMNYFGTESFTAKECDFAYNATQMALQWDALATSDTRVMLAAQNILLQKPYGTSWITYTRCHDDIGLGYDDYMIQQSGFNTYEHRQFLKNYYSGNYYGSPAKGALFSYNPKTGDARISGTLASLCGLQKAIEENNKDEITKSIDKILLMQSFSFFIGGLPMIFYGDEVGYTNDTSYLYDAGKSYDNRWMHRPVINWNKNNLKDKEGSIENRIFKGTQKLLAIRRKLPAIADTSNLTWITPHNIHVAAFIRAAKEQQIFCLYNFSGKPAYITWYAFKESGFTPEKLYDHWSKEKYRVANDDEYLIIQPYGFHIMEDV